MILSPAAAGLVALILVYAWFKRSTTSSSLSVVRGPKSPSFIFGHLLELFQRPAGEAEFAWQNLYGNVIRISGILGEVRLLVADPKALHKVLNTSGYTYVKLPGLRVVSRVMNGKGLLSAEDESHRRQKSIVLPGFGSKECKEFLPIFKGCAEALSTKWSEAIDNSGRQSVDINVLSWVSRGTLDMLGQGLFDIQFGTIQDDMHPLAKSYENVFVAVYGLPSASQIFVQATSKYIPIDILQWIADHAPFPRLARARNASNVATTFAKQLVEEKSNALLQGKGNRDVFTSLVKANMDASAKNKLTDEEMMAQMRSLMMAGHETTATSIAWILLEIARHINVQCRLRDEIRKTAAAIQERGDPQFTVKDLESMPYLNAVIKEGLRLHPISSDIHRMARQDNILPLSRPIVTESGHKVDEIHVPKGTHIIVAVGMYQRDKDIWGEDAHEFNPDRWLNGTLNERKTIGIGVYSNLLAFLSGHRACLGWRFAYGSVLGFLGAPLNLNFSVMEMQTILCELVGKFEFRMTDESERVVRQHALVMAPMVEGEFDRGAQLPLAVSLVSQDGES